MVEPEPEPEPKKIPEVRTVQQVNLQLTFYFGMFSVCLHVETEMFCRLLIGWPETKGIMGRRQSGWSASWSLLADVLEFYSTTDPN